MSKIIAICGNLESGKTTLMNLLIEEYVSRGNTVTHLPFAQPLKELAKEIGWAGEKDDKGRRLLQLLGTEVCRNCISDNYWVDRWSASLEKTTSDVVIVDDMRFANELVAAKNYNAFCIMVKRPQPLLKLFRRALQRITGRLHLSERGLPEKEMDLIIVNDQSIEYLKKLAITTQHVISGDKNENTSCIV